MDPTFRRLGNPVESALPKLSTSALNIPTIEAELLRRLRESQTGNTNNGPGSSDDYDGNASDSSLIQQTTTGCPLCLQKVPILTALQINAVTNCEHVYCYECALRLLFIIKRDPNSKGVPCPICRQTLQKVILTRKGCAETVKAYLGQANNGQIRLFNYMDNLYFDDSVNYDEIKYMISFPCDACNFDFHQYLGRFEKTTSQFLYISKHLLTKHKSYLCKLCFFNLDLFPIEMVVYSSRRLLKRHLENGSNVADTLVKHERCTLCPIGGAGHENTSTALEDLLENLYFNSESLAAHCRKSHFSCYVCSQQTSTFYRTAQDVAKHVLEEHIFCSICQSGDCRQVIGFATIADLKAHVNTEHPEAKIDYESLVRRENERFTAPHKSGWLSQETANTEIDIVLRKQHAAVQQANPPTFGPSGPSSELYQVTFPGLGGNRAQQQENPEVLPNYSRQIVSNLNSNPVLNDEEFPNLSGVPRVDAEATKAWRKPVVPNVIPTADKKPNQQPITNSQTQFPALWQPNISMPPHEVTEWDASFLRSTANTPRSKPNWGAKQVRQPPPGFDSLTESQRMAQQSENANWPPAPNQTVKYPQASSFNYFDNNPAVVSQLRTLPTPQNNIRPHRQSTVTVVDQNAKPSAMEMPQVIEKVTTLKLDEDFPSLASGLGPSCPDSTMSGGVWGGGQNKNKKEQKNSAWKKFDMK